jgi:hypothetical protein
VQHIVKWTLAALGVAALAIASVRVHAAEQITWTVIGVPQEAVITGGPWTLEQSGAAVGLKSAGYCDSSASPKQVGNPGTERMQPYYFPVIFGHGKQLQGYFDYRPKDTNEAVVAAFSNDAGKSWTFQQEVLQLRTTCPTMAQADPDGDVDVPPYANPNNSDNGDDDGQGHQFPITIAGHTYLYTLIRAAGHIDFDPLVIHDLTPTPGSPLNGAPALTDAPTDPGDVGDMTPIPALHTQGLFNPDGILGTVPGTGVTTPLKIIYEQKVLNGDLKVDAKGNPIVDGSGHVVPGSYTDPTTGHSIAFSNATICGQPAAKKAGIVVSGAWGPFYQSSAQGIGPNDDVTFLRLAQTVDGVNFTDLGPLQGLNDPTTTSPNGTRWLATAGTILKLDEDRYGLLFSGGNCMDADSDAFHYIGYAESTDLIHWTVVNGLNNPLMSIFPVTIGVDGSGNYVQLANGTPGTMAIPATNAVIGNTLGFFAGRIYAPSATLFDDHTITVVFAGYHTSKPKFGLGDYRTIGLVTLRASDRLPDSDEHGHRDWDGGR